MVSFEDIIAASKRLADHVHHTPALRSDWLDSVSGVQVFIKPENLQVTGSFKFRGAFNAISALPDAQRQKGIVACSSGNHAQGIAEASRRFGIAATIVMPSDAPKTKIDRTKQLGAEVVLYDRAVEDREALAAEICRKKGASFIHPYENAHVIAGQGTSGLEFGQDLKAMGIALDHMIVCCGGGGLIAGITLAMEAIFPDCMVHTAEPAGFDDYARSLKAGERVSNASASGSICDAILTPSPGEASFAICRDRLGEGLVVSDDMALAAVKIAHEELKLVVEPGGAVALAAILAHRERFAGQKVGIILSGGNIDSTVLAKALEIDPFAVGIFSRSDQPADCGAT